MTSQSEFVSAYLWTLEIPRYFKTQKDPMNQKKKKKPFLFVRYDIMSAWASCYKLATGWSCQNRLKKICIPSSRGMSQLISWAVFLYGCEWRSQSRRGRGKSRMEVPYSSSMNGYFKLFSPPPNRYYGNIRIWQPFFFFFFERSWLKTRKWAMKSCEKGNKGYGKKWIYCRMKKENLKISRTPRFD